MRNLPTSAFLLLILAATAAGEQPRFDIVLKLVKAAKPGETVDAGAAEQQDLPDSAVAATLWPKNIQIDGQPLTEKYYQGKLIARQASTVNSLAPGTHTIWPGDHVFEVGADGAVSTADPELIVDGRTVAIKCYPVMLAAYRVNSPESTMNVELRMLPTEKLAVGIDVPVEVKDPKPDQPPQWKFVDFLPFYHAFRPLTIYLPATGGGKPYSVRPGKFDLAVKPDGLSVPGADGPGLGDLIIRGHRLFVPFRSYSVVGRTLPTRSCQALIPSAGLFGVGSGVQVEESESIRAGVLSRTDRADLTFSSEPHRFAAASKEKPEGRFVEVEGSLARWPEKAFCYDNTHAANDEPRVLVVERGTGPMQLAKPTPVRVRWQDSAAGQTLAQPEVMFFLLPYGLDERRSWDWQRAQASPGEDGIWNVVVPAGIRPGACLLRVAVCEKDAPDPATPLSVDAIVGVADPAAGGALAIFAQKGRDAFLCGETFYLGLAIKTVKPIAAGTPVELDATDPFGSTWPLAREKTPREIVSADSMHFWLDGSLTARLAPGRYSVTARVAALTPAAFAFDLVSTQRPTNFVNHLHGKYGSLEGWGGELDRSRDGQWTAEILAEELERIGVNRVIWTVMGSPIGRYYRGEPERRLEDLFRTCPTLPHWQSIYYPTARERLLNSFLRHGIDFALDIFSYEDDGQPSYLKHVIGSQRYTALQMQAMRHNPATLGFCAFNERYGQPGSNWPRGMLEVHMQAVQQRFLDTYRYSTAEALRARERFLNRPPAQRNLEDLEKFRPASTWGDFQYDDFVRRTSEAANKVADGFFNTTIFRSFAGVGGYLTGTGYPATMFETLQWATTLQYKDGFGFGSAVLFTAQLADVLRMRDTIQVVPAICIWGNGPPSVQIYTKHLFSGISQCVDGIATFMFGHDFQSGGNNPRSDRDLLQDVYADLLTPYGDWLGSLERGYRQVGIYYSRTAGGLANAKHVPPDRQAEGLWIACMRAGFPADYLVDEQILAGAGERYKVIFVPGFSIEKEAPAAVRTELQRLAGRGHILIVDKRSRLDIDGIVRLNDGFDRFCLYTHAGFWFPNHWDADWIMMERMTNDLTALLRRELPKYVQPAVATADPQLNITPDWLQRGATSVLVVPDFEFPDFSYEHIEQFHKPFVKELTFPSRGPVCYDVLENALVPVKVDGDRASITADVRHYGGKIYAFLPGRIGGVRLRVSGAVAAGEAIGIEAEVADEAGAAIDGSFPLKIEVAGPAGKTPRTIYRAAAPKYSGSWVPGLNAPAGAWTVRVTELISGTSAEAKVQVGQPAFPPPLKADAAAVWSADVPAIRKFLQTDREIVIPLEAAQGWARSQAERLAESLRGKGLKVRVADADDVIQPIGNDYLDAYHSWRMEVYPPPMKVEHPAIAIGKRWESRLIEALLDYSVLADVPSELHPGPGRALVQYVWNAYSVDDDLVCVSVSDEEGLRRAVDWLLDVPVSGGRTYKPKIEAPPAPKGNLAAGAAAPPSKRSFRALYSREDEIQAMTVHPATGRILVGTKGWGHNLFCLDAAGKMLWSVYLPEHNVHRVAFSPDGTKAIAGVGMPARIYVLDETGKILFLFDASEYPQFRFRNTDEQNGFPFIINPRTGDLYAWGSTGVMAVGLDGSKRWFLDRWEAMQQVEREVIQEGSFGIEFGRGIKAFEVSPDGRHVAMMEEAKEATTEVERGGGLVKLPISRGETVIYDAGTLKEAARHVDARLCIFGEVSDRLTWAADSSGVFLERDRVFWFIPVTGEAKSIPAARSPLPIPSPSLGRGERGGAARRRIGLRGWNRMVRCEDSDGRRLWQRDRLPMIGWDAAPDAKTVYILDMFGTIHAADAATGADRWTASLANKGMLRALPDGDVLFAGLNGLVVRLAPDGTERWRCMLRELHEIAGDYDAFAHDAKLGLNDISTRLYPSVLDEEGDLDKVVRFGLDVVADGSFESDTAWTLPPDGAGFAEGRTGKRAMQTAGGTVTQSVDSPVIPNATYLLEFHFKPQTWDDALTAGVLVQGKTPAGPGREVLTGMPFKGVPGTWNYRRLAVKTLSDSTALTVGFEARKGTMISVDDVRLRPVRFPSRNFLFNATAHAIKPRFVDDLSTTQRGVPRSLEADMIRQDHVSWYVPGGMIGSRGEPLESMILLQNGQIDDVGKMWHTQPDPVGLNVGLTSPRYISHVVVYFSHQYPGEAWPRFQVKVNDVSVKNYVTVASVRGNRRHFCVVKFDPVLTDLIYIIPVGGITQWDATVTEIEVYGPLGGPETVKGPPADPDATPMFMATPSHARPPAQVDFAAEMNVAELDARVVNIGLQPALADGKLYAGTTDGSLAVISLDDPKRREVARGGTGSLPITGTPSLYSARALVPSADGCLYCLAAGDCSVQWKYRTGGRMLASALPDGDDVYAASDDGKLYKLDIESGMLLWEFQTGGRIRATPALLGGTIFVVSWDGNCYAVSKDNGKLLWKAPVAPATLSSPVAAGGNVFLGDEDGFGRCLDAATGAERWKMAVGGRVSAPAAVLEQCVVFAAEDGTVVCVGRADGKEIWRYKAAGGIRSAPLPTTGGLVVASPAGVDVLNPASGAKVTSFAVNGAFCALPYKGKLVVLGRWQAWVIQPPAVEKK